MRAKFIGNDIDNITSEDILDKETLDHFWRADNMEETLLWEYADEYNIDHSELEDNEEFKESQEFRDYFEEWMDYRTENVIQKFKYEIIDDNNNIPIWRHMSVKENWIDHLNNYGKHLGVFWSWDESAAEAHWGHNRGLKLMIIESVVNADVVDWKQTIIVNIDPYQQVEKEIRLHKNTPLEIISLELDNKVIDPKELTQKIFMS